VEGRKENCEEGKTDFIVEEENCEKRIMDFIVEEENCERERHRSLHCTLKKKKKLFAMSLTLHHSNTWRGDWGQ
jgi:hypothetical protein